MKQHRAGRRGLSGFAISTVVASYGLIIFGSQVRVTDSGMGCPDWPLCDGRLAPVLRFHALMEQSHRYIAAAVTLLVLGTAALAWRSRAERPASLRPALAAVGLIGVQVLLGAVTVFAGNAAPTVAAHLLTGLALLGCSTVTAVAAGVRREPSGPGRLAGIGWVAVAAASALVVSGSLIVNAEAEGACPAFPLCPSAAPTHLAVLHLVHRGTAVLAGLALLGFAVHAWRHWAGLAGARVLAGLLVGLVGLTATFGAVSALLQAPPGWQDLHLAGAAAVLAVTVGLAALGWLAAADAPDAPGRPRGGQAVPARTEASSEASSGTSSEASSGSSSDSALTTRLRPPSLDR